MLRQTEGPCLVRELPDLKRDTTTSLTSDGGWLILSFIFLKTVLKDATLLRVTSGVSNL